MLTVCTAQFSGAEITYQHISGDMYQFTVQVYTDPNAPAPAPHILCDFGDGSSTDTLYADEDIVSGTCMFERRTYHSTHVFPGPGNFRYQCELLDRNNGIVNMPGSSFIPLCAYSELVISVMGPNSSPVFGNEQTQAAIIGDAWVHDPLVNDIDGDSLAFALIAPHGSGCDAIPEYVFPSAATPAGDTLQIDPHTGVISWQHLASTGPFTVAIECTEWRNGVVVGRVVRDMQLCVSALPANVPEVGQPPVFSISPSLLMDGPVRVNASGYAGSVVVYDMVGRVIARSVLVSGSAELSTQDLSSGMYRVVLENRERSASFVVVR